MSPATVLYLISLINNFNSFLNIIFGFSSVGLLVSFVLMMISLNDDFSDEWRSTIKTTFFRVMKIAIFFGFILIFIPSERELYMMVGANYLQTTGIPTKVESIINEKLDYYLQQTKEQIAQKEKK